MTVLLSQKKLEEIGAIARSIGWGAASILHSFYRGAAHKLAIRQKKEGPVTAADLAANDYILKQLRIAFGSQKFAYLSEETYKEPLEKIPHAPLNKELVWIIDPIDGTQAFIRHTGEYAVHIALAQQGRPVVAVVVVPEAGKLYYAHQGGGAFVETTTGDRTILQVAKRDRLEDICIVSRRTRPGDRFDRFLHQLPCKKQQYLGSIGCKIAAIVEQKVDGYISLSGRSAPKDWDLAAPELIVTEAGGKFTHLDGSPLRYNQGDVSQWGCILGSNGQFHEELLARSAQILAKLDRVG